MKEAGDFKRWKLGEHAFQALGKAFAEMSVRHDVLCEEQQEGQFGLDDRVQEEGKCGIRLERWVGAQVAKGFKYQTEGSVFEPRGYRVLLEIIEQRNDMIMPVL